MSERSDNPFQSPKPGFGEKYWNLSAFPSHSFQSGGGSFLTLIFGQILAYSAFNASHFSSPGSVSALWPSAQPNCSNTCRNAAKPVCKSGSSVELMSTPMRRVRSGCCACAASGHATVPLSMRGLPRCTTPRASGLHVREDGEALTEYEIPA